jgi:hypothetical protein
MSLSENTPAKRRKRKDAIHVNKDPYAVHHTARDNRRLLLKLAKGQLDEKAMGHFDLSAVDGNYIDMNLEVLPLETSEPEKMAYYLPFHVTTNTVKNLEIVQMLDSGKKIPDNALDNTDIRKLSVGAILPRGASGRRFADKHPDGPSLEDLVPEVGRVLHFTMNESPQTRWRGTVQEVLYMGGNYANKRLVTITLGDLTVSQTK